MQISGSQMALPVVWLLVVLGLPAASAENDDPTLSSSLTPLAVFAYYLETEQPAPMATGRFDCTDWGQLTVDFYEQPPGGVALHLGREQRLALRVRSASGSRYQGASVEFWEHGGEATLTWDGRQQRCLTIPAD